MVEVDVSRFQNTHHLNTFDRFSVEGDAGGRNDLCDESLQGEGVYLERATSDEVTQTIQQGVHAEQTLLRQRRGLCFALAKGFRYQADDRHQPK